MTSSSDNKSTLGWIFSLGGGVISWAPKKQTCISYFTMESKFIVMAATDKKSRMTKKYVV
jgi:hypothetical protein